MKHSTLAILCLLFLINTQTHAQMWSDFAPPGSKFVYANEGPDQTVQRILIFRDQDTTIPNTVSTWTRFNIYHVSQAGDTSRYGEYLLACDSGKGWAAIYTSKEAGAALFRDYNTDIGMTTIINERSGQVNYTIDSMGKININGHTLRLKYIRSGIRGLENNPCYTFCGPLIERMGSIGYFGPMNMCKGTVYAGRLLEYSDPEIGTFIVPDSLRDPCDFSGGFENAVIEDFPSGNNTMSCYPNPACNTVHFILPTEKAHIISIYTTAGKMVVTEKTCPGNTAELDISRLSEGLYIFRITDPSGNIRSGKMEIKR